MRISDWSSDVCSSDLAPRLAEGGGRGDDAEPRQRDDQPQEAEAKPPARAHRPFPRQSLMRPYWMASYTRSEEHTSELQSLMRISYAVFCLKKKKHLIIPHLTYT